ncbi:MAG: hypothetical protein IJO88_02830 [Oscillospiraceae bacterium]|nr:hypothetical protein [Oscillospiraceae bacterium]
MELRFFVSRRRLTYKGTAVPFADSGQTDTFSIDFDPEWDGLVKLVELRNGDSTAQVLYTGKTPLPRQVCGRGQLRITCYGYRAQGDEDAAIVTLPMVRPVIMAGSADPDDSTAQPDTPSVFAQLAAQVQDAREAADEARAAARELRSLKEQGAFNGPPGQAAVVRVEPLREGPASVENIGTDRYARLVFTLPTKLTSAEKETLRAQLLGDVEQGLDGILTLQEQYIGGAEA